MKRPAARSPHLLRVLVLAGAGLGCSAEAPPGGLVLSVVTDMAVPTDIDLVFWSVTLEGEDSPYAASTLELTSGTDLPLTLVIKGGPQTTAPITVRVEGRKRDDQRQPTRVARDAKLVVPRDRTAKVEVPLSWLCSSANLPEPCAAGTTCEAGECVDARVATESLPDFEPAPALDCYDVTACLDDASFPNPGPITLPSGRHVPCAVRGLQTLGPDADVKVALVVRNERVGNYGFCGPFDECFIPLAHSEAGSGWRVLDNGDIPAIELPPAVCERASANIASVAIVKSSALCPANSEHRPLCQPPLEHGCIELDAEKFEHVCAAALPEPAWVAYACSEARPSDLRADLLECWAPADSASRAPRAQDGRWCCLSGQAASDDPLLIDDMRDGPQIKLAPPEGGFAGWWYTKIPDGSGDLSPAPEALYTYRQLEEPVTPPGGPEIRAAACVSSSGFYGWLALQGFFFGGVLGTRGTATFDVDDYAGISFWGWAREPFPNAPPLSVAVAFPNVQTSQEPNSECVLANEGSGALCDNFSKEVPFTAQWTRHVVRWDELEQDKQDWGQTPFDSFKRQLNNIEFSATGAGPQILGQPFELCVAQLRFEPKAEE